MPLIQATIQSFETQKTAQKPFIQKHEATYNDESTTTLRSRLRALDMPHASRPSRCDAQRARSSSNDKDPPRDTRRASKLDDIEAILEALLRRLQACNEWHLDKEFAEYYWSLSRDEDYYLLLEDCKEKYYVLKTGPCPCTFGEVLRTSGPSMPPYLMSVEHLAHTGEPKFRCTPSPLSPRANAPSSESACDVRENDNVSSIEPSSIRNV